MTNKYTVLGYMIAVGGGDFEYSHSKTELYSSSNIWTTESDYPYGTEYSKSQTHDQF